LLFSRHDLALSTTRRDQDVLVKYEIPATARGAVLKCLRGRDISEVSLFGESEDAFIGDLAIKVLVLADT